jgi:hypothetical protein
MKKCLVLLAGLCAALLCALSLGGCAPAPPRTYMVSEYHDDLTCRDAVKRGRELVTGEPMTYEQCRRDLIEANKIFESMPGPVVPANPQVIINTR